MMPPFSQYAKLARGSGRRTARHGFTLLEVVVAIGVAAGLLLAANVFVLSMGELWGRGTADRLFDRHLRGVTRFLEAFLEQAVVPTEATEANAGGGPGAGPRARPTTWQGRPPPVSEEAPVLRFAVARAADLPLLGQIGPENSRRSKPGPAPGGPGRGGTPSRSGTGRPGLPPGPGGNPTVAPAPQRGASTQTADTTADLPAGERFVFGTPVGYEGAPPMLMFEVDEAPGVCVWPQRALPQVQCALQVNPDEGLVLLWKSRLEEDFAEARPRKTLLSPFVQGLGFEYFDAERHEWTRTPQPIVEPDSTLRLPQRLRLHFVYQGRAREVSISLPGDLAGPPLR